MSDACKTLNKSAVILACHEPTRKVLIPLLLGALVKYNLMDQFSKVVKGFVNGVNIVKRFGDMKKVTSFSLRSLCKTVLQVRSFFFSKPTLAYSGRSIILASHPILLIPR